MTSLVALPVLLLAAFATSIAMAARREAYDAFMRDRYPDWPRNGGSNLDAILWRFPPRHF